MIKATETSRARPKPPEYPLLGISKPFGFVVLFRVHGHGTVVSPGPVSNIRMGEDSAKWDMDSFVPFTGKLLLENDNG